MNTLKKLLFILLLLGSASMALGQDDMSEDDAYDPFADFSEFEPSADEEADIHFFKNGRFFNLGFMLGGRMYTQTMGEVYSPAAGYGLYITYFFDIRTALQVSYTHTEHNVSVDSTPSYTGFKGTSTMSEMAAHMKYYFNTANITRGFADLNPFVLGGLGINNRSTRIQGEDTIVKQNPVSVDFGGGLEIPIARKKMYLGAEMLYHFVKFPDENDSLKTQDGTVDTGIYPKGDYMSLFFILGINF